MDFTPSPSKKTNEKYPNNLYNDDPNLSNYLPFVFSGKTMSLTANANQFQKTARWAHPDDVNAQIAELIVTRNRAFSQHLANLEAVNEENLIEQHKAHYEFKNTFRLCPLYSQCFSGPSCHALGHARWRL